MSDASQQLSKKESRISEGVERTKPRRVFTPAVDIIERKDDTLLTADLPGVDENTLDITLEKNVITIKGAVEHGVPAGSKLVYGEYEMGDYERAFTLSDEVDKDRIQASVKNGVLRLVLPKSTASKTRKIAVSAE